MNSNNTNYRRFVPLVATLLVSACGGGGGGDDPPYTPPATNSAPTIAAVADSTVNQDTVIGPIQIGIADRESDPSTLMLKADVEGSVVATDGVSLAGTGAMRTITLQPLEAATGPVRVTLTVTDPQGATSTNTFTVTVNARAASIREWTLATFAKAESDDVTAMNGYTFTQDADDPAIYEPLIGVGEE